MTNELEQLQFTLKSIAEKVETPFWKHLDFWISFIVGVAGVYFSVKAFREAEQAKKAARAAGRTVKFQNTAIELREIKFAALSDEIRFTEARNVLSDKAQKLHRILSSFETEMEFSGKIKSLYGELSAARESLKLVKPVDQKSEIEAPQAIYNAIENHFAVIDELTGDLIGLFEQRTAFGDDYATNRS